MKVIIKKSYAFIVERWAIFVVAFVLFGGGYLLFNISASTALTFPPLRAWIMPGDNLSGQVANFISSLATDGTNIYAGTWGDGVFRSDDNSESWTAVNTGLNGLFDKYIHAIASDGTNLFAGTDGGGVFLSTNNGDSWSAVNTGLGGGALYVYTIAIDGTNIYIGTGGSGVYLSTNNGASWTAKNTGLTNSNVYSLYTDGSNLIAGTTGGGVFLSTDNGDNWTAKNNGLTDTDIRAVLINNGVFYAGSGTNQDFFVSTDSGDNWTQPMNLGAPFTAFTTDGSNVYASSNGGCTGTWVSSDDGTSWQSLDVGIQGNGCAYTLLAKDGNLFIGTIDNNSIQVMLTTTYAYDTSAHSLSDPFTYVKVDIDINGTPTTLYDDVPISNTLVEFATWLTGELGDTVTYQEDGFGNTVWVIDGRTTGNTYGDLTIYVPSVPGAPTSLTPTPSNTAVSLSWTAPADDGGSPLTDYVVQYKLASSGFYLTFADGVSTSTSAIVTGLANGSSYNFRVAAKNAIGNSTFSNIATATPATVPSVPQSLSATPADSTVSVTWSAPASTGGSAITYYQFEQSLDGSTWTDTGVTADGSTFSHDFSGLTNGTLYYFHVLAHNAAGDGLYADAVSATPLSIPSKPLSLNATAGDGQVVLTWAAPTDDGGATITGYTVTGVPSGSCVWTTGPLTCTILGLTNRVEYSFTVVATNGVGDSAPSDPATATPTAPASNGGGGSGGSIYCTAPTASNYGGALPCVYNQNPLTCTDPTATNLGGSLPCAYNQTILTCTDSTATNFGGILPCTYPQTVTTCGDQSANNFGGALPCIYTPSEPFCVTHPTDPSCLTTQTCPSGTTGTYPNCVTNVVIDVLPPPPPPSVSTDIFGKIKNVFNTPGGNIVSKLISTTSLIIGALGAIGLLVFATQFSLSGGLAHLGAFMMVGFGIKKRERPWGTVYNSVTKQPLDPVYLTLVDKDQKEISTAITDLDGRYGFLVPPGWYMIRPKKTNFIFPSIHLGHLTRDEVYLDLYFGNYFEIKQEGEVITKNIPMDPENFDWNEVAKADANLMKFYSKRDLWLVRISEWFFRIGFLVAILALIFAPRPYNIIIFALYVTLLIFKEVGINLSKLGSVVEKSTGAPLPFAIIRVFSLELGNEVVHKITTENGLFYCLVPDSSYYITIEKKNADGSYTQVFKSDRIDVTKGVIKGRFEV